MDRDTKLSFIPKKSLAKTEFLQRRPVSLFLALSFSFFIITSAVYGGSYFYANTLKKDIETKRATLEETKKQFDLSIIEKAKNLKSRIESAKSLIGNHIALSSFFDFLGGITLRSVGYSTFQYSQKEGGPEVSLNALGPSYASAALQRDAFSLEVEKKSLVSFSVGGYRLDEKGNVGFAVKATLNPATFLYKNTVKTSNGAVPPQEEASGTESGSNTTQNQ